MSKRSKTATTDAAEWFIRLHADDVTHAEREQFVSWLRESPAHVAEILRIAELQGEWVPGFTGSCGPPRGQTNH